jgi:hypothetical protein
MACTDQCDEIDHCKHYNDNSVLANALRLKRKERLLSDIDDALLKAVYEVLAIAEVFDTLEFSSVPTIEYVLPSYYLLHGMWNQTKPTDLAEVRRLKKELINALDGKMWTSIVQLHFAATFLDPSLRELTIQRSFRNKSSSSRQN